MNTAQPFVGTWRVIEMDVWDKCVLDIVGPAYFRFRKDGFGKFWCIEIDGEMDCRFGARDGKPLVEFSWLGYDGNRPTSGRGWAVVDGDAMTGRIFFHGADDSAFAAKRGEVEKKRTRATRKR